MSRIGRIIISHYLDLFGHGLVVLCLCDISLLQHLTQNPLPAFPVVFLVIKQFPLGRVLGNSNQRSAFRNAQLADILAEIQVGRSLYAIRIPAQMDRIEVRLHNLVFRIGLFQTQRPEYFLDFPLNAEILFPCNVFNQLLGNRRAALRASLEKVSHGRIQRAFPVHALMLFKPSVLTGDCSIDQMIRNILIIYPDTVFFAVQAIQFHIFTS